VTSATLDFPRAARLNRDRPGRRVLAAETPSGEREFRIDAGSVLEPDCVPLLLVHVLEPWRGAARVLIDRRRAVRSRPSTSPEAPA
jgi:hypothetical protein